MWGQPVFFDRGQMVRSPVSHVVLPPKPGKPSSQEDHETVARTLRQYGSGGNRNARGIALHDRFVTRPQLWQWIAVHQHVIRLRRQLRQRSAHSQSRGAEDVESVYLPWRRRAYGPSQGGITNNAHQPIALTGGH